MLEPNVNVCSFADKAKNIVLDIALDNKKKIKHRE